ncbi:hypothetical protein AB0H34_30350 [Saccharopolyspora shandongensis]
MKQQSCPFKMDPTGRDVYAEAAGIRRQGPAARWNFLVEWWRGR